MKINQQNSTNCMDMLVLVIFNAGDWIVERGCGG